MMPDSGLYQMLQDVMPLGKAGRMPSVLIVDDTESIRFVLETGLSVGGWKVYSAATAMEALRQLAEGEFDLVIMDIGLPDMSGLDVVEALHKERPKLPVIMLSVQDDSDTKVRALVAGASDYITKPFRVEEILSTMELILKRRQPARAAKG